MSTSTARWTCGALFQDWVIRSAMTLRMPTSGLVFAGAAVAAGVAVLAAANTSSFMIRPSFSIEDSSTPRSAASLAASGLLLAAVFPSARASTSRSTTMPSGPVGVTRLRSRPLSRAALRAAGEALTQPKPRTSRSMTMPSGPVAVTLARSTPSSSAILRAAGEALTRPSLAGTGAVAAVVAGAAVAVAEGTLDATLAGATAVAATGAVVTASPAAPTMPTTDCTGATLPSATRISSSIPLAVASIWLVILSVATSNNNSPWATASPTFLNHWVTVPSVIVRPSCGILISDAMR